MPLLNAVATPACFSESSQSAREPSARASAAGERPAAAIAAARRGGARWSTTSCPVTRCCPADRNTSASSCRSAGSSTAVTLAVNATANR